MKGLLVKDICLLLQRKRFFLILAAWALVMGYSMAETGFVVGWLCMIMAIFSLSTLNYDEYDNSMPFLMSMPVSAKDYAVEKYLFGFCCGIVGWLFAILVELVLAVVKHNLGSLGESLSESLVFIPVIVIVLSLSLPVELKWGAEKGRTYMLVLYGIIFLAFYTAVKVSPIPFDITAVEAAVSPAATALMFLVVTAVITAISLKSSICIMEKKEF